MACSLKVVPRCVVLSFHISKNVRSADPFTYFLHYPYEIPPHALAAFTALFAFLHLEDQG